MRRALLVCLLLTLIPACEDPPTPAAPSAVIPSPSPSPAPTPGPTPPVPALALSCQAEPRSGDAPLTVRFRSFPAGGTGTYDFAWQFGDGEISGQRNPSHTYSSPGAFNATLLVTSGEQARSCQRSINVTGTATAIPPPSPPPPGPLPDVIITIVGLSYSPNPANVRVNQRVIWRNSDTMTHTATADAGAFDTGFVAPGASSAAVRMTTAGAFPYHCRIHAGMVGSLTVSP